MSQFDFVDNVTLRNNINIAFDHIVDLLTLSESDQYKKTPILVSSLRKTIIIHTASIIESLLLWKLKKKVTSSEVILSDEWKYFDINILYKTENEEIIAGKRRNERKNVERLDFVRIIDYCIKHKIIKENLSDDLHEVRKLRNRLHIGGLVRAEKKYTHEDLNFVFDVAKKIKNVTSK